MTSEEKASGQAPEATESPACPVCGSTDEGIVIGTRGRFGMAVQNVICPVCTLVYQSPRPTVEAMNAYYGGAYREHYGSVGYVDGEGRAAAPGQPGYEKNLALWHEHQARNIAALCQPKAGERILEVGCRDARTLRLLRDRYGIVPFGVEPGPEQAAQACAEGVTCFAGVIEDFVPPEQKFDQVQLLHVLEHLHDPLSALVEMRKWLVPGGRLFIEVPNVYQPYGSLEGNFFQNAHLTNFSWVTLGELFRRAGFHPLQLIDDVALFGVAVVNDLSDEVLPLPFERESLLNLDEDAGWLYERLRTYAELEEYRRAILARGASEAELRRLCAVVQRPAFVPHLATVVSELTEAFVKGGSPMAAIPLLEGVLSGPHPTDVLQKFAQLANQVVMSIEAANQAAARSAG